MLYVFSGTDAVAVREKAHAFLRACEKDGSRIEPLTAEECERSVLEDRAGGASLFGDAMVTLIDTPSESREAFDTVLETAELLGGSANTFVLIEGKLLAADKKALAAHATELHELKTETSHPSFNIFSLADALARKDKKSLWILLVRARAAGLSAEEIIGTLFWQVKTMRLAARVENATTADLKPFVYKKASAGVRTHGGKHVERLARELIDIYHRGHLGLTDIDLALERFVLRL